MSGAKPPEDDDMLTVETTFSPFHTSFLPPLIISEVDPLGMEYGRSLAEADGRLILETPHFAQVFICFPPFMIVPRAESLSTWGVAPMS